jgi:hypothetical protein
MTSRRWGAALLAAWFAFASVASATQNTLVMPTSGPMSMAAFVGSYLNPAILTLGTCSSGSTAPANGPSNATFQFQCWWDTSTSPFTLRVYDGSNWVARGTLNTTTHAFAANPASATVLGGVNSITSLAHNWIAYIDTAGLPHQSQPAFSDLSGNISTSQMNSGTSASGSTFWRGDGTWAAPPTASAELPQGRLTLTAGSPVMTASTTAGTIRYDCYNGGNLVWVFNGTTDVALTIGSCDISAGFGNLVAASVFDVWAVNNAGTLALCIAINGANSHGWASDTGGSNTSRGTGYSALDYTTRSFVTNKNAITCDNGLSATANRATHLGTICTDAAVNNSVSFIFGSIASGGGAARFCVWNRYNQVAVATAVNDNGASYTYASGTVRQARASSGNQITFVYGDTAQGVSMPDFIYAAFSQFPATVPNQLNTCIGFDSTTTCTNAGSYQTQNSTATAYNYAATAAAHWPSTLNIAGIHTASANESSPNGTNTFAIGGGNVLSGRLWL